MMMQGNGHCCACSQVCGHIGGPYYCAQHSQCYPSNPFQQQPHTQGSSSIVYVPDPRSEEIKKILEEINQKLGTVLKRLGNE